MDLSQNNCVKRKMSDKKYQYILNDSMYVSFWKMQMIVVESKPVVAWKWGMGGGMMIDYEGHRTFGMIDTLTFLIVVIFSPVYMYAQT